MEPNFPFHYLPYRQGVGMMVLNSKNEVFVGRRLNTPIEAWTEGWQMPQGGIEEGETPLEAALRELKEEIGTNHVQLIAESKEWHLYDFPEHLVARLWSGNYRGQQQKWFAFRFIGDEKEINLATLQPEFSHWRWIPMHEIPRLAISFKQKSYQLIIEELEPKILCSSS